MELQHNKIWLKGLLIGCPMGWALDDCPVEELRKAPIKESLNIVDEMRTEEIYNIIKQHKECIRKREKNE
jgi:hypothetical protein